MVFQSVFTSRQHCDAGKAGKPVPAFLGYIVPDGVTFLGDSLIKNSLLPVVLDLDETLLVANSVTKLISQIGRANTNRCVLSRCCTLCAMFQSLLLGTHGCPCHACKRLFLIEVKLV